MLKTKAALGLVAALLVAGTLYGATLGSHAAPGTAAFEATTWIGSVPADEDRTLHCVGFMSGPLVDPQTLDAVRVVSIAQSFEANGMTLTRMCAFELVDPLSTEPISARYTVGHIIESAEPMPVFTVELSPRTGLAWKDVQEFEDMIVEAQRSD